MERINIAVDVMGGDNDPQASIKAVLSATEKHHNVSYLLFGREDDISSDLMRQIKDCPDIEFFNASEVISQDDSPMSMIRKSKYTSMGMAIHAVQNGKADGVVSSGNTGALMAISKIIFRTLPGIERPAMCSIWPSLKKPYIVLDIGANVSMTPKQAVQFGIMGNAFYSCYTGYENPRCGILNIGSEDHKGTSEIKEAKVQMEKTDIGGKFVGFVESQYLHQNICDVVVTDGFTGNIALKATEGVVSMILKLFSRVFKKNILSKIAYLLIQKALSRTIGSIDPKKYNGAMFLGLSKICIKSHGNADAISFLSAIGTTILLIRRDINKRIEGKISLVNKNNEIEEKKVKAQKK